MGALRRAASSGFMVLTFGAAARRAVAKRDRTMRRVRLHKAYAEAAQDLDFMEEMMEVERDFAPTVADGLDAEASLVAGR